MSVVLPSAVRHGRLCAVAPHGLKDLQRGMPDEDKACAAQDIEQDVEHLGEHGHEKDTTRGLCVPLAESAAILPTCIVCGRDMMTMVT